MAIVKGLKSVSKFEPVMIEITLVTEKELKAFYALFNYGPVLTALQEAGGFDDRFGERVRGVLSGGRDNEAFKTLTRIIRSKSSI